MVDKHFLDDFVQKWIYGGEKTQLFAYLYGRYETREGSNGIREIALVYSLYTPKQSWRNGKIVLERDPNQQNVNALAKLLNLQIVGCVMTSPPRTEYLSSFEVDFIAPLQYANRQRGDYLSKFVTVVISRNEKKQIEPTAFMLSDQCLCMHRDGLFLQPQKADKCRSTTTNKYKELLSSVIQNDEKLGSREVTEFEPLFFLVELTVTMAKITANYHPIFKSHSFPEINSSQETKDTLYRILLYLFLLVGELVEHLKRGRSSGFAMMSVLSDFNLLVQLGIVIGVDNLPSICQYILNDKPFSDDIMVDFLQFILYGRDY